MWDVPRPNPFKVGQPTEMRGNVGRPTPKSIQSGTAHGDERKSGTSHAQIHSKWDSPQIWDVPHYSRSHRLNFEVETYWDAVGYHAAQVQVMVMVQKIVKKKIAALSGADTGKDQVAGGSPGKGQSHTLFGSPAPQARGGPVPQKCAFWDWCDVTQVGYPRNFSPPAARWDVPLLWSAKAVGTPVPSFPYTVGRPTVPGTPTQKKYL
ncbi:hypothetical protein C8R43DRAFT_957875 [Mycena crocata]|nr:hypothetical protein C8R43DRAFT_957875 [Mycena crocata]